MHHRLDMPRHERAGHPYLDMSKQALTPLPTFYACPTLFFSNPVIVLLVGHLLLDAL